jgi:hypothetical protein
MKEDPMADLNALLDLIPVGDIAKQLGINEDVAEAAVKQVLPGLVGGLAANANRDEKSAEMLSNTLKHHNKGIAKSVADVDTEDGKKIVRNVFGENEDQVVSKLAGASTTSDVTGDIIKQVLPIVAPIVLSFIATQFLAPKAAAAPKASAKAAAPAAGGIDLGGMLGGLLSDPSTQQMVGGLLGGLLGGGKK